MRNRVPVCTLLFKLSVLLEQTLAEIEGRIGELALKEPKAKTIGLNGGGSL
jgi:hypothetical protein